MHEEILINVTPSETRVAVVENGMLQEVYVERSRKMGIVGNVYKGKVSRVLPGMQAAFIEMGLERAAFLHANDILSADGEMIAENAPGIHELVHEGQTVLVQVIKDPIGTKGARLTTHITVPSRYLVLLPGASNVAVSARIEEDAERNRLLELGKQCVEAAEGFGYIVRTAGEGVAAEGLAGDARFLRKLWASIEEKGKAAKAGELVHQDLPLVLRTLRDSVRSDLERIKIDSRETYQHVISFCERFLPELTECVEYYPGERPIFDLYSVEDEIQKALDKRVQLKSGGYLIIDQTEAMTTIDVNTGGYVGHRNLEETIFKTNLEATQAIARQVRLRNLGGIIIVDFIDMEEEEHKRQVLRVLEKNLEKDRAKTQISEVSSLGLVQMTRKRTRESLEHVLCHACPTCYGRGSVKTPETVSYEIFREIMRESRQFDTERFLVLASQGVVNQLLEEESASVAELEAFIGKTIKFQVETSYSQEQFDVVPM